MKTKLYRLADVQPILSEVDRTLIPDAADIERKVIKTLTIGMTTYAPLDERDHLCCGDKVVLRITSALPRFNKEKISIVVGSGLYDAAVEDKLVGMCVGETANVMARGENAVFTILSANRIFYPELTDDMVENQKIEGIHTVDEYRAYVKDKEQRSAVEDIVDEMVEQLVNCSEFSPLDPDDITMLIQALYDSIRQHCLRSIHVDVDQVSPIDLLKIMRSLYRDGTIRGMMYCGIEKVIPICLIYCALLRKPCEGDYDPTMNGQADVLLRKELVEKYRRILIKEE